MKKKQTNPINYDQCVDHIEGNADLYLSNRDKKRDTSNYELVESKFMSHGFVLYKETKILKKQPSQLDVIESHKKFAKENKLLFINLTWGQGDLLVESKVSIMPSLDDEGERFVQLVLSSNYKEDAQCIYHQVMKYKPNKILKQKKEGLET